MMRSQLDELGALEVGRRVLVVPGVRCHRLMVEEDGKARVITHCSSFSYVGRKLLSRADSLIRILSLLRG